MNRCNDGHGVVTTLKPVWVCIANLPGVLREKEDQEEKKKAEASPCVRSFVRPSERVCWSSSIGGSVF